MGRDSGAAAGVVIWAASRGSQNQHQSPRHEEEHGTPCEGVISC